MTIAEMEAMANAGRELTIADIKEMPSADGWGHIPTIGEIEATQKYA